MSTIKSSAENLTLNADGSGNDVIIQSDGSTVVTVDGSNSRVGIVKASSGAATDANAVCHLENSGSALLQITSGTSATAGVAFGDSGNSNQASVYYDNTVNDMIFRTDNAEKVRFLAGGGITFNGDTAAANALDDYEEGTWTPVVKDQDGNISPSFSHANSTYTKIGRMVTVTTFLTNISSSGLNAGSDVVVWGLPFTVVTPGIGSVNLENVNYKDTFTDTESVTTYTASTYVYFRINRDGDGSQGIECGDLNSGNSGFHFTTAYFV